MRRSLALLLAMAVPLLGLTLAAPTASAAGQSTRYETITADDGTPLRAFVVTPTGRGDGPLPLLVMPSSWSMPNLEYVATGWKLAKESGYEVISYTSRGFWDSG